MTTTHADALTAAIDLAASDGKSFAELSPEDRAKYAARAVAEASGYLRSYSVISSDFTQHAVTVDVSQDVTAIAACGALCCNTPKPLPFLVADPAENPACSTCAQFVERNAFVQI